MNKDSYSINITGLTDEEVRQRVEEGLTNRADISTDKTTKEIVISNVFTYFNLIFLVITILLIMVGSFRNLTFLPIIIGNTVIGIVQEIRAKKTLEKMSLLNAPRADVIRNGSVKQISTEELVKDDVILLTAGKQICADAVVISGNIQVNESLLTGEADEVEKTEGSTLMSGSFVVSGECYARLEKVGNESYISKLSLEAKSMGGKEQSEMIRSINLIVKWVGIVIIPIGLILFWQSHFVNGESITKSVTSTVAAIIGMIPEGLYLLTTVALALSTMKLARKKVLLHDMKSIETLARVDVLCVDKTGTITEPDMKLKEIFLCKNSGADGTQTALTLDELKSLILDYANASVDNNATMLALKAYAADALTNNTSALHRTTVSQQAFSSSLKYGSVTFSDGTYLLGAPEFIMHEDFARIEEEIIPYADKGDRVLLFARYDGENVENGINGSVTPLGFVALANPIRENAVKTFEYFKSQGVAIKVISGDNPRTVSRIAIQAGIESAQIVDIIVFHIYFAHFTVPDVFSFSDQLVETILAQFLEIQFRLLITDKRRSDTCVNDLPFLGSESDDRSGMVALNFCFVRENVVLFHAGSKGERFVELDDKVILEVLRHSAAVLGRITDDLVFFRNHLHIRAFVECVDNDISVLGFRIRETEHSGTLRRNEFRSNVVVCEIYLIIIRFGNLRLVREPAGALVLVEYQSACDRHDGKLTVVVHPRAGLMCLFEAPDFVGIVGICPTVPHFSGLRCPEVHSPRQCRGRIGISGR